MDAGSALSVVSLGIQICQGLLNYYNSWKSYGADITTAYDCIARLSKTFEFLRDTLSSSSLDPARTSQIHEHLDSCVDALLKLRKKLEKLQTNPLPCGFRQKALAKAQRMCYPLRESTLIKLREIVDDVQDQLSLALQVLHLDIDTTSRDILTQAELSVKDIAARTLTIETSVTQLSTQHERLLAGHEADQFRKIVNWLSPPDPEPNHRRARQHHEPETGLWLLQSEQYKRWRHGGIRHLWLHGKPGCGKTILTSTVIEDIRLHCRNTENAGFATFYFSFSDTSKQSFDNLLCSLVAQLGWKEPGQTALQQEYNRPGRGRPGSEELEDILLSSILRFDDVFLLMDALDECPDHENARWCMLAGLERLSEKAPNLKIFATSRELLDIQKSMFALDVTVMPISTPSVNADITRHVLRELSCDPKLSALHEATKTLIIEKFTEKADGMFRWASCQLQALRKLKSFKRKYVEEALHSLPATLDATYERILTGIEQMYRKEALVLLRWLAYAQAPLDLDELAEATIIDPDNEVSVDMDDRGNIEDVLGILSELVVLEKSSPEQHLGHPHLRRPRHSKTRSPSHQDSDPDISPSDLRAVRDATVRLAHFSVKEYLESERIVESNARDFHLDMAREQRFLALSCLAYITHYSRSGEKRMSEHDLTAFPLLAYSACSWFYHSLLQESTSSVSCETTFLTTSTSKHHWLSIYQPDRPHEEPFKQVKNVGSALYYASFTGLQTVATRLIAAGTDIDAQGGEYGSALGAASYRGHDRLAELLIGHGANINLRGPSHQTALHYAVLNNRGGCVQMLLDRGAEITTDIENMTALHYTTRIGPELAQRFLSAGISIDTHVQRTVWRHRFDGSRDVWEPSGDPQLTQARPAGGAGLTPLHYAVLTGSEVMTRFFLEKSANVNALSQYNETPLHLALRRNVYGPERESVFAYRGGSKRRSVYPDDWNDPQLRIDYVLDMIGLTPDDAEEYGRAQEQVDSQRLSILDALLSHDETDVTCKDIFDMSPLHCVPYGTRLSTSFLERLLTKGIPVDLRNSQGQTALHLACLNHDFEAIESLIEHGASILATDDKGFNALHCAARGADSSCIQLVLDDAIQTQSSMVIGAKDGKNQNALHILVDSTRYVDIAAVQCLTTGGIDVNSIDRGGYSPLARYLRRFLDRSAHKAEIAEHLFQAHADPLFRTVDGLTLGHLSAFGDELGIELLQVLAKNSVDLRLPDLNRRTILHHSALHGSLTTRSALDFLYHEVGLSISAVDSSGKTALDLAIGARDEHHHPSMFRPDRWSTTEKLLRAHELDSFRSREANDVAM